MAIPADEIPVIKQYVLEPDQNGVHLRKMAECMAEQESRYARIPSEDRADVEQANLEAAAETIASFINLAWGGAGLPEYARRSYLMLSSLRDRMRGMDPESTWRYAIDALNVEIQARLRRSDHFVLDSEGEKELIRHLFDALEEYDYLHDLVSNTMQLHWQRRHGPQSPAAAQPPKRNVPVGPRGSPVMERHLRRAATEAVATYVEQANIAWGMVENPTDTAIVLRDRIGIQRELGAINEQTWEDSGWKLARFIEARFGTRAGCREARLARGRWKSLARRQARTASQSPPGPLP
jgi:hypothetical protein